MKYPETPDITLKMIIDSGFLKPDTKVYASIDENITGIINSNGAIEIIINGKKMYFHFQVVQQESLPKQVSMVGNFGKLDIIMN